MPLLTLRPLRRVALIRLAAAIALAVLTLPTSAHAFKIGYKGIPIVVSDFPPVHEAVTAEAVRHFCQTEGLPKLLDSPVYAALFTATIPSCDVLTFNTDIGQWRGQMQSSPIAGLLLGARYPDLREMAGVDADKQDVTVVKYDAEVQIDSYRLYPQFHGQLSKYHNIWGGDQKLGLEHLRTWTRSVLYEARALVLSFDPVRAPRNELVAANAMLDHDANRTLDGLFYDVRWHNVLLGSLFHSMEDGFSHDPLHVLDVENERLIRGAIFYGRFTDAGGNTVEIPALYPTISPELAGTMSALSGYAPIVRYTPSGPLRFADIPQTGSASGESVANYFEHTGKRFQSGHLGTTLAMYAVAEFLGLLQFAVDELADPDAVEARIEAYLDKWFSIDLNTVEGFTPTRAQDIAAVDPEYAELPWYDYHFVDLWQQSGLRDRTVDGKQAFILPWSDRNSMGDILMSPDVEPHFVLVPADEEHYDEARRVFYVQRDTMYLFASWYRGGDPWVARKRLDASDFMVDGKVQEREVDLDHTGTPGLDTVYASAFVPAGYRACFHAAPELGHESQKARTAAYDIGREQYRCFYGTEEGRWAHVNFHLRKGTRIYLLPIDADGDGVPFLRGIADAPYADNCPLVANADQADRDANGRGDACECTGSACPDEGTADGGGDGDDTDAGAEGSADDADGASDDSDLPGDGTESTGDGADGAHDGVSAGDGAPNSVRSPADGGCGIARGHGEQLGWSTLGLGVLLGLFLRRRR